MINKVDLELTIEEYDLIQRALVMLSYAAEEDIINEIEDLQLKLEESLWQ